MNRNDEAIIDLHRCLETMVALMAERIPEGGDAEVDEAMSRSRMVLEAAVSRGVVPADVMDADHAPSEPASTRPGAVDDTATNPPKAVDVVSARRFRALMRAGGEAIGWAGFDADSGVRHRPETPGAVHVGMTVSSDATEPCGRGGMRVRSGLFALAEDMLAVDGIPLPTSPVGSSIPQDALRWNALMRLPRIKTWKGTETEGDVVSFFAEFWSHGEEKPGAQDDPATARVMLTRIADAIIGQGRA